MARQHALNLVVVVKNNAVVNPNPRIFEIDGWRGVAIIAVVVYHFFPWILPSGFLGVDLFFVISGFVITRSLHSLQNKSNFYGIFLVSRVNRLVPPLLLVLVYCWVVGYLFLSDLSFLTVGKDLVASLGFFNNINWISKGVDYFSPDNVSYLLLHLWSLGVEAQFYLLFPLLFLFDKARFYVLISFLILSFAFLISEVNYGNENTAFFHPMGRAWEFLFGSIAAFQNSNVIHGRSRRVLNVTFCSLVLVLFGSFFIQKQTGLLWLMQVLVVVIITSSILTLASRGDLYVNKAVKNRFLCLIGKFSYSWYLWHWALLTSIKLLFPKVEMFHLLAGVAISMCLAFCSWQYVESWFSKDRLDVFRLKIICISSFLLFVVAFGTANGVFSGYRQAENVSKFLAQFDWPYWNSADCSEVYGVSPCFKTVGNDFSTVLIGDSHANHLVPGLITLKEPKLASLFNGGRCPPLWGLKVGVTRNQSHHNCAGDKSIERVTRLLESGSLGNNVETIILSANWSVTAGLNDLSVAEKSVWGDVRLLNSSGEYISAERQYSSFKKAFLKTLGFLEGLGLKVIVIGDSPQLRVHPKDHCLDRFSGTVVPDCKVSKSDVQFSSPDLTAWFKEELAKRPNVHFVNLDELFCDKKECSIAVRGNLIFRDMHHLAVGGSQLVAQEIFSVWQSR